MVNVPCYQYRYSHKTVFLSCCCRSLKSYIAWIFVSIPSAVHLQGETTQTKYQCLCSYLHIYIQVYLTWYARNYFLTLNMGVPRKWSPQNKVVRPVSIYRCCINICPMTVLSLLRRALHLEKHSLYRNGALHPWNVIWILEPSPRNNHIQLTAVSATFPFMTTICQGTMMGE